MTANTAATAPDLFAAAQQGVMQIYPRRIGRLKLIARVKLTREILCELTRLPEADMSKLLLGATYSAEERTSNRHVACLGPYVHANRIWLRGETPITDTHGNPLQLRWYSEHFAFIDARYSGPACRATKLRALATSRAAALNAAAVSGDLDTLIAVLKRRPECSVMPVPLTAEDLAQAA